MHTLASINKDSRLSDALERRLAGQILARQESIALPGLFKAAGSRVKHSAIALFDFANEVGARMDRAQRLTHRSNCW